MFKIKFGRSDKLSFFVNKQKKIEDQLTQYCGNIFRCSEEFKKAIYQYCRYRDRLILKGSVIEVHKAESVADDIRRDIEVMMYSKSLFPESRRDILILLETMDKVPNQMESAAMMILEQHISIPEDFCQEVMQLVDRCCLCVDAMLDSVKKIFTNFTNATISIGQIDGLESEADKIESFLIEKIFSSEIESTDKILLRDFVKYVAQISDKAEDVGDKIRIIVAKRSI